MNRYEFEDKISDYIDNQLSSSERKAFENYAEENREAKELLSSTKNVIDLIKEQPPLPSTAFGISIPCATTLFWAIPSASVVAVTVITLLLLKLLAIIHLS